MCLFINLIDNPPPQTNKPPPKDPTTPTPTPTSTPTPTPTPSPSPSPSPTASALSAQPSDGVVDRTPFPTVAGRLSAARAEGLFMATSAVFASAAKVEAAFVAYADGNVIESEKECRRAIEHAQDLMSWLARIQSDGHARIALRSTDKKLILKLTNASGRSRTAMSPTYYCFPESCLNLRRVQSRRTVTVLCIEREWTIYPAFNVLANNLLVSLEVGLPAIRQGELFEALSFRLEPTYLERTFSKLVSALIGLNLKANYAAAVSRVAAQRSLTQPVPTK